MHTELVSLHGKKIITTSQIIAEKFGKNHKNVLKKTDKLITEIAVLVAQKGATKSTEIFTEKSNNYRGRKFRYFEFNRHAFTLLVMGFTGIKALKWKRLFNDAFYAMENVILQQSNTEWVTTRERGKRVRLSLTDEIKSFVDYATGQGSKNANKYYMALTKMQYKALSLIEKNEKVSKEFRQTLDFMELDVLLSSENVAKKAIIDGMTMGLHYKEIYQLAKQRVMQLSEIMMIK